MDFLKAWFKRGPSACPSFTPGADLEDTLRRLGIPLDFGVSDAGTALVGGLAKANLFQAHQSLAAQRWDEALRTLSGTLDLLAKEDGVTFGGPLGVGFFLRGVAHERKGLTEAARSDYARALSYLPQHQGARAGQERLAQAAGKA